MSSLKRRIFGIDVDVTNQTDVVQRIMGWCERGERGFVVTPNLDHVVKLRRDPAFREAYSRAKLVLPDGKPFVWLGNLRKPMLSLVTGSDLIEPVCAAAARKGQSVFFFGSSDSVIERAVRVLKGRFPDLIVAGAYSPPMGFQTSEVEKRRAIEAISAVSPDIVFAALGAPKQEIWADEALHQLNTKAILCIGAGLDFLAGEVSRAPMAFRRAGLEWLWRALSEPQRLGKRYLKILMLMPLLLVEHVMALATVTEPSAETPVSKTG
jgi:N-acetylglucosaminyldiphosphoundecaprenol N-acetyl-beta-D-mannosaminyltransferase